MQVADGIGAEVTAKSSLEELADQRVIAQLTPRAARASAQERHPFRGRREPRDSPEPSRPETTPARSWRDDLEDRGLHQELLELVGKIADDLLGEVVVELLVGSGQAADEPSDLRRASITKGRLDQLE